MEQAYNEGIRQYTPCWTENDIDSRFEVSDQVTSNEVHTDKKLQMWYHAIRSVLIKK